MQKREQDHRPFTTCAPHSVLQCTVEQSTLLPSLLPRMKSTAGAGECAVQAFAAFIPWCCHSMADDAVLTLQ